MYIWYLGYAQGSKGRVEANEAVLVAYMKGLAPSPEDLARWDAEHGPGVKHSQLQTFLAFCVHTPSYLASAFAAYDESNTGYVSRFTLVSLLMVLTQDPNTEQHVDILLRKFGLYGDGRKVNYIKFADALLQPTPNIGIAPSLAAPLGPSLSSAPAASSRPGASCNQSTMGAEERGTEEDFSGVTHVTTVDSTVGMTAVSPTPEFPAAQCASLEVQAFVEFAGSKTATLTPDQACEAAKEQLGLPATPQDIEAFERESGERVPNSVDLKTFLRSVAFAPPRYEAFTHAARNGVISLSDATKLFPLFGVLVDVHPMDAQQFSSGKQIQVMDYATFQLFTHFVQARHAAFQQQAAQDATPGKINSSSIGRLAHIFGFTLSLQGLEALQKANPAGVDY